MISRAGHHPERKIQPKHPFCRPPHWQLLSIRAVAACNRSVAAVMLSLSFAFVVTLRPSNCGNGGSGY